MNEYQQINPKVQDWDSNSEKMETMIFSLYSNVRILGFKVDVVSWDSEIQQLNILTKMYCIKILNFRTAGVTRALDL